MGLGACPRGWRLELPSQAESPGVRGPKTARRPGEQRPALPSSLEPGTTSDFGSHWGDLVIVERRRAGSQYWPAMRGSPGAWCCPPPRSTSGPCLMVPHKLSHLWHHLWVALRLVLCCDGPPAPGGGDAGCSCGPGGRTLGRPVVPHPPGAHSCGSSPHARGSAPCPGDDSLCLCPQHGYSSAPKK